VCLSACSTGTGDFERGEGIYGLRSAFLAAGAESMVSVLWEADDAVTETLMVTYYQLMFQGNSRADALRNAMAAIKQTHPHPFYWAGFVFSGVDSLLRLPAVNSSSW
jgi:CHAT domain-containing protein